VPANRICTDAAPFDGDRVSSVQDTEPVPLEAPPSRTAIGVWARIHEHKILQWGIGYLGAALAVAQGTELFAGAFDWPELVSRSILVALVIGFPIALTVAWYHGHRGLKQMSQGELAIVSVLLLIGAVFFTVLIAPSTETAAAPVAASVPAGDDETGQAARPLPNSIAVLPFVNLSSDREQEYFADGLSEELLNQLSKIQQLLVTARTSSFAYKGRTGDIAAIGRELRVGHVLEGSVRKAGNEVRITAQLIDTTTGFHLWSETYDGQLADVFALQDEIARSVAKELQVTLGIGQAEFRAGGTANTAAYEHYLLARSLIRQRGRNESARTELEEALELDGEFGLAQIELAQLLTEIASQTYEPSDLPDERERAIDRAVAIAPDLPGTSWLLAQRYQRQRNWQAAERAVERMWALSSPNDYAANANYGGFFRRMGFARESLPYSQRARLLDPLVAQPYVNLGLAYDALGDYASAIATYDDMRANAAALVGNDVMPHVLRVLARGDVAAARRVLEENCAVVLRDSGRNCDESPFLRGAESGLAETRAMFAQAPAENAGPFAVGSFGAAYWGDTELATEAFGKALLLEPAWLTFAWVPIMDPVRRHPRFKEILIEMELPDYWRGSRWPERCRPLGERDFECF
jgi:TolB-like protein